MGQNHSAQIHHFYGHFDVISRPVLRPPQALAYLWQMMGSFEIASDRLVLFDQINGLKCGTHTESFGTSEIILDAGDWTITIDLRTT